MNAYGDIVIQLHDLARQVEQQIGTGQISEDLRNVADRINTLGKPMDNKDQENVQDAFR